MFVRYSMLIITLKKIVELMYYVRPILDVDYCTKEHRRADLWCSMYYVCRYSMSIMTLKKMVKPKYYVRPIFDVDYYTEENCRADVLCSSDIRRRLLH